MTEKKCCPECLGLGLIPVFRPPMPCPECNGLGYIEVEENDEQNEDE